VSELSLFPGVDYLGPLPAAVQQITVFSAGLQTGAKEAEGRRSGQFITAPPPPRRTKKARPEPG